MTNLTNSDINLNFMKLKDLQTLAKEFKVKSWWTMKKEELKEALFIIREEQFEAQGEAQGEAQEEAQEETPKAKKSKKSKKAKAPKVEKNEENLVTLKELASEFKMKGTKARRLLRNETAARPFGGNRWEWDKDLHKKELELARNILKAHTK